MGRFVNRTTKAYVPRGHTPDFPVEDWIQNPNLDNVIGVAEKYWKITRAIEKTKRPDYRFDIVRDEQGDAQSMIASQIPPRIQ